MTHTTPAQATVTKSTLRRHGMVGLLGVAAFLFVLVLSSSTGLARAVWTTDASGQVQGKNIYESQCGVYLDGEKWPAGSTVYVRVTATDGDSLNYQGPSTVVANADGSFGPFGPLCPYDPSKNGAYKAWASLSPDFRQGDETKTDNFKVKENAAPRAADDLAKTDEDVPVDIAVLANDRDPDGDALTVTSVTAPGHGTAISNGTSVRYVPNPDWSGSDSFRYSVSDSLGGTAEAQVMVTVSPANDLVTAVEDGYVGTEGTLLSVSAPGVQGNDAAPDGGATASVVSPVSHGTLTLNGNGAFGYMPAANWSAVDVFEYRLTDADGDGATARVTISVLSVDDPVAASDEAYTVSEDETLEVRAPGVLGNDSAPDGGVSVALVQGVAYGTLTLEGGGAFRYSPVANWSGTDRFVYRLSDGDGDSAEATATITVLPVDDPVTAADDSYRMAEDDVQSVQAPGVAENDTAPDGRALVSLVSGVARGALTLNGDGSFDYVPERDWSGIDRFEYRLEDGDRDFGTATATITVIPVDDPVTAADDDYPVAEDRTLDVLPPGVTGNDSAPDGGAAVRLVRSAAHGTLTLREDGSFSYTSEMNWNGTDRFVYRLSDGDGDSAEATATITALPEDDPVTAVDDAYGVAEDETLSVSAPGVLENDSAPDGGPLVALASDVMHGALTLWPDGSFSYTPEANWNGTDRFVYQLSDVDEDTAEATVTVTVTPVDDPVDALDDSYRTAEDTPLAVTAPGVLGNDTAPDGGGTIRLVSDVAHGTLTLREDGPFTYEPEADWNGIDRFTYQLEDGNGDVGTATATVIVTPVNDAPVARDDTTTASEDSAASVPVLANDTDPDGDALSVISVSAPAHGSVIVNPDGTVTYTPAPHYSGQDGFTYEISDGNGGTDTAAVSVTLTPREYALAIRVVGTGTVTRTPERSVYRYGEAVRATATAGSGWAFWDWSGGLSGDTNPGSVLMDGDETVTATFAELPRPSFGSCYSLGDDGFQVTVKNSGGPGCIGYDIYGRATVRDLGHFAAGETKVVTETQEGTLRKFVRVKETAPWAQMGGTHTLSRAGHTSHGYLCDFPPVANDDATTVPEDTSVRIDVAGNDTDREGALNLGSVAVVRGPARGTATVDLTGQVTYTPAADWNGTDVFEYQICDAGGLCDTATVTVTVEPVDDAPVAANDAATTAEDVPVAIDVLANDTDVDGNLDPRTVVVEPSPGNGTAWVDPMTGWVTYTPDPGTYGTVTFGYRVCDAGGLCALATVTIEVTPVDDPVRAVGDAYSVSEGAALEVSAPGVVWNDLASDGGAFVTLAGGVSNGFLVLNADGSFTYTPNPYWSGVDWFSYRLTDEDGDSGEATVTIEVTPVDDPVSAGDDAYRTSENAMLIVSAPGVLGNDWAPDGGTSIALVSGVSAGVLVLNADGSFRYVPQADWSGTERFAYQLTDVDGDRAEATVTIEVSPGSDPPVAGDDSATVTAGAAVTIDVLANDQDPDGGDLRVVWFSQPAHGVVGSLRNGTVRYTAREGYVGPDVFLYTVRAADGDSAQATVTVTVVAANVPPIAKDNLVMTLEGTSVEIDILANDVDLDGSLDRDSVVIARLPMDGRVDFANGMLTYTPDPSFYGTDHLTYFVADDQGAKSNQATVTIGVMRGSLSPLAWGDTAFTQANAPVSIDVAANDEDPDGRVVPETVRVRPGPRHGAAAVEPDGRVTYVPDRGFVGTDLFAYQVEDDDGNLSNVATVIIEVAGQVGGGGATASLCEGKVVISEVGWAGTATSPRDEWIELRNLGATSVDLSGWTLRWRRTRPPTSADQEWKTIQLMGVLLPGQLSACDQVVHGETSSFEIVRRDDVSWLVVGSSLPTREGHHLLERGSDETIRDASASQVYDEGARTGLALADEGEALELVNAHGRVVDTANAFHPGEDGWAAGDAAMAASMERTDPLGPDVAENWHTNLGVVTSGVDVGGRPVMATAGGTNSPALEALVLAAGVERTAVPAGKRLDVGLDLSRSDRKQNGWPWILVTRPDLDSAGSGGALDVDGAAFSGRYVDGLYWLTIDTARLTFSGACDIWIVYGAGKVVLVSLDVVEP